MFPRNLIEQHYAGHDLARQVLLDHSRQVADLAVAIARRQVDLGRELDLGFVEQAAWLHDIGMLGTQVPQFGCHGSAPYICHGVLGARMLVKAGLPQHALVCERHIGVGLTVADIRNQKLPLPARDMSPQTLEEQIVAYADLFFSKSKPGRKFPEQVRNTLARYSADKVVLFDGWHAQFGEGLDRAGMPGSNR